MNKLFLSIGLLFLIILIDSCKELSQNQPSLCNEDLTIIEDPFVLKRIDPVHFEVPNVNSDTMIYWKDGSVKYVVKNFKKDNIVKIEDENEYVWEVISADISYYYDSEGVNSIGKFSKGRRDGVFSYFDEYGCLVAEEHWKMDCLEKLVINMKASDSR